MLKIQPIFGDGVITVIYGYARVSSKGQEMYGNSLDDQERQLREAGCNVVVHDSFTGTKMDRPAFSKLVAELKSGDRLVVTKLDRFARTTSGGIDMINELLNRGVSVHILNMGLIDNTPTGKLIVTILLAFAEFERNMIVERTQTGKAVAKANNPDWRVGRKEIEIDDKLFKELRKRQKKRELTVAECCEKLGIGETTWYNRIRQTA